MKVLPCSRVLRVRKSPPLCNYYKFKKSRYALTSGSDQNEHGQEGANTHHEPLDVMNWSFPEPRTQRQTRRLKATLQHTLPTALRNVKEDKGRRQDSSRLKTHIR